MVKLSIVIPYYKTYELTKKLLDVLCKQLTKEVEVFLIDDGCNETKLDEYSDKINIEHLEKNVGGASAMNVALKKVSGKYVAIIDSDDLITNDYIETLLEYVSNRDEDVIFFNWQDMNTGEIVRHPQNYAPWKAIYKRRIMPFFREGWIYSYDIPFQEDLDKIGYSRYYIDKILYLYNSNRDGSLTVQKEIIRRKEMIKVEAVETFTLARFDEIKDTIERKGISENGKIFAGDKFLCPKDLVYYLSGRNHLKRAVVKVIEIRPDELPKAEEPLKPEETSKKKKRVAKKKEK